MLMHRDLPLFMKYDVIANSTGKYADMIVLDSNLFETDVYKIHDVNVVETIMDGVTRFKK